jgi:hypothetical protein
MATLLIAVVAIGTYVSPFALIYVWVIRLWDVDGRKDRRALWAWVSLGLVSLAVTVYWLSASHPLLPLNGMSISVAGRESP